MLRCRPGGNTMIQRKQRIAMRDLSTMAAEDREMVEKNAMNGRVFNIFKVLAHHPKLVKRWTPFAGHILAKQTLPFRDREPRRQAHPKRLPALFGRAVPGGGFQPVSRHIDG